MDRSGVCERLGQQLQDHRDPSRVRHSLTSQLRTLIIQHAQGWDHLSDTQLLGEDPAFQMACSDQRSTTPLTQQRPSQPTLSLFLHHFFLVTSLDSKDWHGHEALSLYRRHGKAEGHMGELKDTLNVHLSSICRGAATVQNVMGRNQVSLLLSLYAYQFMHSLRMLMQTITFKGWSLRKVREQILKIAATVAVHARRIRVHIGRAGNKWWPVLLRHLSWLHQAPT